MLCQTTGGELLHLRRNPPVPLKGEKTKPQTAFRRVIVSADWMPYFYLRGLAAVSLNPKNASSMTSGIAEPTAIGVQLIWSAERSGIFVDVEWMDMFYLMIHGGIINAFDKVYGFANGAGGGAGGKHHIP